MGSVAVRLVSPALQGSLARLGRADQENFERKTSPQINSSNWPKVISRKAKLKCQVDELLPHNRCTSTKISCFLTALTYGLGSSSRHMFNTIFLKMNDT